MTNPLDDYIKKYEVFRKYDEHENLLINHRITWMLAIHGFLYATYGLTIQKLAEILEKAASFQANHVNRPGNHKLYCYMYIISPNIYQVVGFLWCIIVVGVVISLSALLSIRAAYLASQTIHNIFYRNYRPEDLVYDLSVSSYDQIPLFDKIMNIVGINTQPMKILEIRGEKFPILSGGGRQVNEFFGSLASWAIPFVLLISWGMAAYYLHMVQLYDSKILTEGNKCPIYAN